MEWRKVIVVVAVVAFGPAQMLYADMTRVSEASTCHPLPVTTVGNSECRPLAGSSHVFARSAIVDLGLGSAEPFAKVQTNIGDVGESQPVHILSDRQDSLCLCLYALLSLGLCKSAPWVKKLSLGVVPGWYHDGGPFQVGHSHAISPDCLTVAPGYCFIQPDNATHHPLPRCRREMTISLLRKSQFTPTILASRGPPFCSIDAV